jgi:eukaryotic-like serine/threonine-protein kinase
MSGYSPKLPANPGIDSTVPASERYRILGRIASGGMAEIYLARMMTSAGTEREVVLKRLMPELQSDHEFIQMFYDEARIASNMRHPNIVQIYELGELDGSLFISMEVLRGTNLRDLLARLHRRGERLPIAYGVKIASGALEALSYAHRFTDSNGRLLNVVHRDVSPQNIIVTYDGSVKLVDFGVAKAEGRLHQTRAGLIKGKFAYMSPEQIGGGRVDGRSDQFALAEVFYELFLKRHPFYAESDMEVLRAILDADPMHPSMIEPGFPPEVGAILMRALRKNPSERFPTAAAMNDAFEAYLQQQRTPVTTIMLGRFARDLFADRIEMEQRARERGDERMLIESMAAGRAEPISMPKRRTHSHSRPAAVATEEREAKYLHAQKSGKREAVEIARAASGSETPASGGTPPFIAHSGYTDPGVRRKRFQSQVRRLFDDPAEPTPSKSRGGLPEGQSAASAPGSLEFMSEEATDAGEMPTMLGGINVKDLDELRREELARKKHGLDDAPTIPPPAADPSGDTPKRNVQHTPRGDRTIENGRRGPRSGGHAPAPRSRPSHDVVSPSDRWGLLLFVAGLGALVGAIVYAVILYTGSQTPLMRLEVRSTPAGASIVFDGTDTAAETPTVFQNIASNREHTLELRLEGYEPHTRKLPPAPEIGELIVNWTFKPVSGPN